MPSIGAAHAGLLGAQVGDGIPDGTTYIRGDYRFIQDTGETELLDYLEARLQSIQGGLWYRLGYHVCRHDEENGGPCSWDNVRENGDVPADIPTFDVT